MSDLIKLPPDLWRGPVADVLPLAGEANWGLSRLFVDDYGDENDGRGIVVGVVDTGIDATHPDLRENVLAAKDFTGSSIGPSDRQEHGTHVSGTIGSTNRRIGVAPGCKLVHGKGLGDDGSGLDSWIAAAMRWCAAQGAQIVSMSLGSGSPSPGIDAAGRELTDAGVLVVCAAGNSGGNTSDIDWPGRYPWAISVASVAEDLTPSPFSSAGASIKTSAPGSNIWSTRPGGKYRQMSGTSMATPFAAGVLARYLSGLKRLGRPLPKTAEVIELLKSDSVDKHTPGVDRRTGPGVIWPGLFRSNLDPSPSPVAVA